MPVSRTPPSPYDDRVPALESNPLTEGGLLKSWAEGSVWSTVCALELGLIKETTPEVRSAETFANYMQPMTEARTSGSSSSFTDAAHWTSTPRDSARRRTGRNHRLTRLRKSKSKPKPKPKPKPKKSPQAVKRIRKKKCTSKQNDSTRPEYRSSTPAIQTRSSGLGGVHQRSLSFKTDRQPNSSLFDDRIDRIDKIDRIDSDEDFLDHGKLESSLEIYAADKSRFASSTLKALNPKSSETVLFEVDPFCPSEEEKDEGFGGDTTTSSDLENSRLRSDISSVNSPSVASVKADGAIDSIADDTANDTANSTAHDTADDMADDTVDCPPEIKTKTIIKRQKRLKNDHLAPRVLPQDLNSFHDLRRVTRGSTRINKENFVGKLVWGSCSGWWPALIIDAEHAGMIAESGKLWVYWIGESRISLLNERTQIEPFYANLQSRLRQKYILEAKTRAVDVTMQMLRDRIECVLTKPYHVWIEKNLYKLRELEEIKFYPYPAKIKARLDQLKEINAKANERYAQTQKNSTESSKKQKDVEKPKEQVPNTDPNHLSLMAQRPGVIAWAKIAGHNWWPAMILDYRDCCMREPSFGCQWIMWYGDYKLSQIHHRLFLKFPNGLEKMHDYTLNTKKHLYLLAVLHASQDYYSRLGYDTSNWSLVDVFKHMSKIVGNDASDDETNSTDPKQKSEKYSTQIINKLNELKLNSSIDEKRKRDIKSSGALRLTVTGEVDLQSLCLRCLKISDDQLEEHPFFKGSLCKECLDIFAPCIFVIGNDGKCFYCTVCVSSGTVVVCDREECPRVYCTACLKYLLCPKSYKDILLEDPWKCFLCRNEEKFSSNVNTGLLTPRSDSKERIIRLFRTSPRHPSMNLMDKFDGEKKRIRVLSLFDGLSTGLLVLQKLGISVEVYYASEIDHDALMVSFSHFGNQVIHLGDVRSVTKKTITEIAPIDLLIGGSPCNDLSLANPARLGLHDPKGTGILFFDYCRVKQLVEKANKRRYLFWFYENVASMPTEYRLEINKHLGQEPDVIDSADFSPQHRLRLYWHNLPVDPNTLLFNNQQDVQDILTPHCNRYALVKKIQTVTTKKNSLKQGKLALKPILMKDASDSLWITELEEIFGFPRHYTDVKNLSATKRQRLIGKSWSVQTLTAIFRPLRSFFQSN